MFIDVPGTGALYDDVLFVFWNEKFVLVVAMVAKLYCSMFIATDRLIILAMDIECLTCYDFFIIFSRFTQ